MTVTLALAAAACWAVDNLVSLRFTRGIGAEATLAWSLAGGVIVGVPIWLVVEGAPPAAPPVHVLAVAMAAAPLYLLGNALFLKALRAGSLSVVSPIVGLDGGIAAVFGLLFLGQSLGRMAAAGLVLAVAGGALAGTEGPQRAASGVGWAAASAIAFGGVFVSLGEARGISPLGAVLLSRGAAAAAVWCWLGVRGRKPRLHARAVAQTTALGTLDVVAFTLFTAAAAIGPLAVASVCAAQFATVAVALGAVVLAERLRPHQYVGVGMTLTAVALLSAGS
ncbi:MAG TPA: EamA family transporter [Gaiellales bacterium]|nr:EamA family transporter [Gaiellales bacterium]